jgi:hypothetical protein
LTSKARSGDAHPHHQVVPCSWQRGGPITLASDTCRLATNVLTEGIRARARHAFAVSELLARRPEILGVNGFADITSEATRWTV